MGPGIWMKPVNQKAKTLFKPLFIVKNVIKYNNLLNIKPPAVMDVKSSHRDVLEPGYKSVFVVKSGAFTLEWTETAMLV